MLALVNCAISFRVVRCVLRRTFPELCAAAGIAPLVLVVTVMALLHLNQFGVQRCEQCAASCTGSGDVLDIRVVFELASFCSGYRLLFETSKGCIQPKTAARSRMWKDGNPFCLAIFSNQVHAQTSKHRLCLERCMPLGKRPFLGHSSGYPFIRHRLGRTVSYAAGRGGVALRVK